MFKYSRCISEEFWMINSHVVLGCRSSIGLIGLVTLLTEPSLVEMRLKIVPMHF